MAEERDTELGPLGILADKKSELTPQILRKLTYLERFDLSRERDKLEGTNVFDVKRRLVPLADREFRRFISLKLIVREPVYPFSPTIYVDFIWHELIIDSRRYFEFCDELVGEYIHHNPFTPNYLAEVGGLYMGYTKARLQEWYGAYPPAIWGAAGTNGERDVIGPGCDLGICFD